MTSTSRFWSGVGRHVLAVAVLAALIPAQAQESRNGLRVTVPNGYANITQDDMRVQSTAGAVRWTRTWDGQEWKFNPHWESLSQSWKNLTGSQSEDTTVGTVQGASTTTAPGGLMSGSSGSDGCYVWVDEDWSPTVGTTVIAGIPQASPLLPERTTPFNRVMGEGALDYPPVQRVNVDYAALCMGMMFSSGGGQRDTEGIRRANELYLGDQGRYAFNNRSILEKRSVRQLPTMSSAAAYSALSAGQIALAPVANAKGFRWIDKGGDWIEYNTQGQVVAWGDRNDNVVWMQRDTDGILRGVVDANGRVIYSLHYTGALVTEVRDYAAGATDLPSRSAKYQYDSSNRLTQVTDVRGNVVRYDYDAGNHIVKLTDQEGRVEQLAYSGDTVVKRTAPDGGVTDYVFDYDDTNKQFSSKITGPATAAGRRVEDYTHSRVAKIVRQIVNGRTDLEVRYDTGARAETRTNARGFATRISKNEFEQVVQVDYPDSAAVKRSYSALHLGITEETDELGVKTKYQYDAKGNLTKRIEAVGTADERTADLQVNSLGQVTSVTRRGRTEANGTITADAVWQLEYDTLGQIRKTTDPEGSVRQNVFTRTGSVVRLTDPRGNLTSYEVDASGNLTKVTDALGGTRSYQYDKAGNVVQMIDPRAKVIQASYDAMNRLLQTTNAVGGVRKLQYNGQGLPVAETDEDGRTNRAEFDNFLRVTKQTDGLGHVAEHSYNIADGSNAGSLGAFVEPTETVYPTFTQRRRYDPRERPTSDTLLNPARLGTDSLSSSTTYDKRSQVISNTDAYGKTRFYAYDALGQLIEATDALGNKTQAAYDTRGNLIQLKDANGNVHRFELDRNDRVVKEVLPLGQVTIYSYDAAGNAVQRNDPRGNKTVLTHDATDRLTQSKRYDAAGVLQRSTTYSWDAAGNLVAWSDKDEVRNHTASASATYDDANRKTGESVVYPGGYTLGYGYAYSAAGLKTRLTWPDGTNIDYGYSAHGELETVTIPGEGTISVNQFKWLVPAKVTLPGGAVQERGYDGLLNLESLKVKNPGQQLTLDLQNTYGKMLELKQSNRTDSAASGSLTKNSSFAYDDELRLTQATVDSGGVSGVDTETFTLDAVANRLAHSKISGAWTYDANNRLTQRGTGSNATTSAYDSAGNLTQKTEPGAKVTRYVYDTQNRLVEVQDGGGNLIARYGYDLRDARIWKEQYRDRLGAPLNPAKRTYYLYSDEGLIGEATQDIVLNADQTVSANGVPAIRTQYGPRPDSHWTTGTLFLKAKNSAGIDAVAYLNQNHLGAPNQATDKQGHVVWAASYNAFGRATVITPEPTIGVPTLDIELRLPGQTEDTETGLHYNYYRYYDPSAGRYTQADPVGLRGGINTFAYAGGNPVSYIDPDGRLIINAGLAGLGAVIGGLSGLVGTLQKCGSFREAAGAFAMGAAFGAFSGVTFGFVGPTRTFMSIATSTAVGASSGFAGDVSGTWMGGGRPNYGDSAMAGVIGGWSGGFAEALSIARIPAKPSNAFTGMMGLLLTLQYNKASGGVDDGCACLNAK